ncbi:MAG: HypC/HybG/HupF family hydrogenase formation chaperone [Candidatus Latescibacterota bacterium]|jgi:hydrogenase expression/formation protein HypC
MCLAVPGQLLEIKESEDPLARTGRVSFGGVVKEISLAYLPEAKVGDYVTVHVGFALSVVTEEDARLVFDFLRQRDQDDADAEAA